MKSKLLFFLVYSLLILSCSKEKEATNNFIGTWKGKKIQETFEKNLLAKRYTDLVTLDLKGDNTGTFQLFVQTMVRIIMGRIIEY